MSPAKSAKRQPGERDWWSLSEWAEEYGYSRWGAQELAARGGIPGAMKFGGKWRISKVAFLRHFHGEAKAS